MTNQYPPNPAFPGPGYPPNQAPHQPGGVPSGQGQPHGQSYAQPYGQFYGQQFPQPYEPVYFPVPQKPRRPGNATAASVLGIVGGGMGIFMGFFAITFTSSFQGAVAFIGASPGLSALLVLSYIEAFGTFLTAVALLTSGITFLKGKGGAVLLISAVSQAAMALLFPTILLMIPQLLDLDNYTNRGVQQLTSAFSGLILLAVIVGLGLAASIIGLLLSPTARSWRR